MWVIDTRKVSRVPFLNPRLKPVIGPTCPTLGISCDGAKISLCRSISLISISFVGIVVIVRMLRVVRLVSVSVGVFGLVGYGLVFSSWVFTVTFFGSSTLLFSASVRISFS